MMPRTSALVFFFLLWPPFLLAQENVGDARPGYLIDFAPIAQATDNVDAKMEIKSKTAKGDTFERGLKINGRVREETATNLVFALKTLYEAQEWKVKEIGKTQLLVIGKGDSPVEKMEIEVKGLDKKYHPTVKPSKTQ